MLSKSLQIFEIIFKQVIALPNNDISQISITKLHTLRCSRTISCLILNKDNILCTLFPFSFYCYGVFKDTN
ncbi:hypothetical protein V1477_018212 [Vespula maculifrons]|uniref:Uncharacterized protein n=1 Tax=Vespula maculifrons TaxID=7453 RepID=A0ABD2AYT2_VESMC